MKQFFFLLLLVIFKYHPLIEFNEFTDWIGYCDKDFEFCPICFPDLNRKSNDDFFNKIHSFTGGLAAEINTLFGSRTTQSADWIANGKHVRAVLKYLSNFDNLSRVKYAVCRTAEEFTSETDCDVIWKEFTTNRDTFSTFVELLKNLFLTNQWNDGIKLCPADAAVDRIHQTFNRFSNEATFWIQFLINPELIAIQSLKNSISLGRFVPRIFDWRGFIIVEQYAGKSLYEFYNHPFNTRILLAKQLLEAAIAFSHGLNGFRYDFL